MEQGNDRTHVTQCVVSHHIRPQVMKSLSHATKGILEGASRNWGMVRELELRKLTRFPRLLGVPPYLSGTVTITLSTRYTVSGVVAGGETHNALRSVWEEADPTALDELGNDELGTGVRLHTGMLIDGVHFKTKASCATNKTDSSGVMMFSRVSDDAAPVMWYGELVGVIEHRLREGGPTVVVAEVEWLHTKQQGHCGGYLPKVTRVRGFQSNQLASDRFVGAALLLAQHVAYLPLDASKKDSPYEDHVAFTREADDRLRIPKS